MIIGHERQIKYLKTIIESGNVPHAFLFSGPEHIGKTTVAFDFVKSLECRNYGVSSNLQFNYCDDCDNCRTLNNGFHPDFIIIEPEGQEIKISQIRDLRRKLAFKNYSAPYKVAVINKAESLNSELANAVLKTLEEPQKNTILILIASNSGAMLPTIISRCQLIRFLSVPYQTIENGLLKYFTSEIAEIDKIPLVSRISCGRPGLAIKFLNDKNLLEKRKEVISDFIKICGSDLNSRFKYIGSLLDSNKVEEVFDVWLNFLESLILAKFDKKKGEDDFPLDRIKMLTERIKETGFILRTTNVNPKLTLEVLMTEL